MEHWGLGCSQEHSLLRRRSLTMIGESGKEETPFGFLFSKKENFLRELKVGKRLAELAAGYGKSLPQLAIAWVLRNEVVSVALVGMRNEQELQQKVGAAEWELTETDLKAHSLKQLLFVDEKLDYYNNRGREIIARQQLNLQSTRTLLQSFT